jgi:hypothetical protein
MKTPKLEIQIRGEVVASNIGAFRAAIAEGLGNVNLSPETDVEFGQAELDAKDLAKAERGYRCGKGRGLEDAEGIYALLSELDEAREEVRQARLTLEKRIKGAKEERRGEMVEAALDALDILPIHRERRRHDLEDAVKGRRTIETIRQALDERARIIGEHHAKTRALIERIRASTARF